MTPIRRLPYLTPSAARCVMQGWRMVHGTASRELPAFLSTWDPAFTIQAIASVLIDGAGIADDCALAPDARFRLAVSWYSAGTVLIGRGDAVLVSADAPAYEHQLVLVIPGTDVAQRVELRTHLVLDHPGTATSPFAPTHLGAVLWTQSQTVELEGEGARFPVQVVDFHLTRFPPAAGWALYWDADDLTLTLLGSVRLLINAQHTTLVQAITEDRPEHAGIWEAIRFDVVRTLLMGGLSQATLLDHPARFAPGTVGATIVGLLHQCFPHLTPRACRDLAGDEVLFTAHLQAALRLFGSP